LTLGVSSGDEPLLRRAVLDVSGASAHRCSGDRWEAHAALKPAPICVDHNSVTAGLVAPGVGEPGRAWGRLLAGAAGILVVLSMGVAAAMVSQASLRAAEDERLGDRQRLVQRVGEFVTSAYRPRQLAIAASRTPFPRDDPVVAARLLDPFRTSGIGDPTALAAVVRRDGSVLATSPAGAVVPIRELGDALRSALEGEPARTDAFTYDGATAWATAAPVGYPVWGVVVVVQKTSATSAQLFFQKLGSLETGTGGPFWLDRQGRALVSWEPSQVGTRLADPAELARRPQGRAVTTTSGRGPGQVTTVSVRTPVGTTVGFEQRTDALFADLHSEQRRRILTLLAVFAVAAGGLLLSSMRRLRHVRRSRARLGALLRNTHDLILVVAADGVLSFVSPAISSLLGHDPLTWHGRSLQELVDPVDGPRIRALLEDPDGVRGLQNVQLFTVEGQTRWFDVEAGDVSESEPLRGVLLTCHEIGRRKLLQDELIRQARHDALTGLPNRIALIEVIAERISGHAGVTVLFVDLDGFKAVNDTWGHAAGDDVLRAVSLRMADLVGSEDVVCRFAGDEFGIVLSGTGKLEAIDVARRVVEVTAQPVHLSTGELVRVGASVGIAISTSKADDADELLRAADGAMYRAKQAGRRSYALHSGPLAAPAVGDAATAGGADASTSGDPGAVAPESAPVTGVGGQQTADVERMAPDAAIGSAWARERRWLAALAPVVGAVIAIVAVAGVGVWQSNQARGVVESKRLDERLRMTESVAEYVSFLANPQRLLTPINAAPWALDGSAKDDPVMQTLFVSDLGGTGARLALYTPEGRLLNKTSDRPPPGITPESAAWRTALTGHVGHQPLVTSVEGKAYGVYAIPVLRRDRDGGRTTAAVLVVAQMLSESVTQRLMEALGSLGFGVGGVSTVERGGRVTNSWDSRLIGDRLLDPGAVPSLPPNRAVVVRTSSDRITLAAAIGSTAGTGRKATVYEQPTDAFFGDLRTGQTSRDLALVTVVLLAVAWLVAAAWRRERAVRRGERRLDALLRHAHDIVAIVDGGNSTFISAAMSSLLGHDPHEWLHRPLEELVHPDDYQRLAGHIGGIEGTTQDIRLLHIDGTYRWFDVHAAPLPAHRSLRGVVITCHEMGERQQLHSELSHSATRDALTGLLNRTAFVERLEALTGLGLDDHTVLFIDLDRFKPVNDTLGHAAGDDVLRTVAQRIRDCTPEGCFSCRLGGDEFAVLLTGGFSHRASEIAGILLESIRQPILLSDRLNESRIDATIGIASSRGLSPADVLRHADLAMYRAKQAGRGRYAFHS
jgi:diguanylate cyclase (GGDEF)-like protein/PAS domain S-box-containing protein